MNHSKSHKMLRLSQTVQDKEENQQKHNTAIFQDQAYHMANVIKLLIMGCFFTQTKVENAVNIHIHLFTFFFCRL